MAEQKSNYFLQSEHARKVFLNHDQQKMIDKFNLKYDENYLYINFISREYRIFRETGNISYLKDGTEMPADFNGTMAVYDLLCDSKEPLFLSGKWTNTRGLVKNMQFGRAGGIALSQPFADFISGKMDKLIQACEALGGKPYPIGDVAYILPVLEFFPVVLQFWERDDEFQPQVQLLWDENTLDFFRFETTYYIDFHLQERIMEYMKE